MVRAAPGRRQEPRDSQWAAPPAAGPLGFDIKKRLRADFAIRGAGKYKAIATVTSNEIDPKHAAGFPERKSICTSYAHGQMKPERLLFLAISGSHRAAKASQTRSEVQGYFPVYMGPTSRCT